jgi:hypothetical protein
MNNRVNGELLKYVILRLRSENLRARQSSSNCKGVEVIDEKLCNEYGEGSPDYEISLAFSTTVFIKYHNSKMTKKSEISRGNVICCISSIW